jgi:phospholipase/carboxylesterase
LSTKSPRAKFSYLASGAPEGAAEKLVVLVHGYGRDASLMLKLADEISAWMPQARIIMPQAPELCDPPESDEGNMLAVPQIVRNGGQAQDGSQRQWFSLAGGREDIQEKLLNAAGDLNLFIDEQQARLKISDKNTAIMGFSQGGAVALATAFTRAAAVACAVGHSTFLPQAPEYATRPPVLYIYGTADEEFPQQGYYDHAQWMRAYTDLKLKAVQGLTHRTSAESRGYIARYIADRLQPP